MIPVHIAIVGMGPRGLTVLERLLEHSALIPSDVKLVVEVFDERECGEGVHRSCQPDHLLINTVASQVTMFEHGSQLADRCEMSLVEWARSRGIRLIDGRFTSIGEDEGVLIGEAHHLPRSLLGQYLGWYYRVLLENLPANVHVIHRPLRVIDLEPNTAGVSVHLSDRTKSQMDFVFLTTGHGSRKPTEEDTSRTAFVLRQAEYNPALHYYPSPYPIEELDRIPAQSVVAVQGFGLTAHDVISALTVGRGGKYSDEAGKLRYIPSGLEPCIGLFSRSCLPFAARGLNQKALTGRHICQFFTAEAVELARGQMRALGGNGQLDFDTDILPLLQKEMVYAWRTAVEQAAIDPASFEPTTVELQAISSILWPLKSRAFASIEETKCFFEDSIKTDLAEAVRGNLTSAVKAATDVMRDARDGFRAAIEYGGLTPRSHRSFVDEFNPIINRVSFGPPLQRSREYLALREAGLIDIAGGVGARVHTDENEAAFIIETRYGEQVERTRADVLVIARLDTYSPLEDATPLWANLLREGTIRPYRNGDYHPGGLDIDRHLHPLSADGTAQMCIWAIGYVVEGPHYYTHALPRPHLSSRHARDAGDCVLELLAKLDAIPKAPAGKVSQTHQFKPACKPLERRKEAVS